MDTRRAKAMQSTLLLKLDCTPSLRSAGEFLCLAVRQSDCQLRAQVFDTAADYLLQVIDIFR